MTSKAPQPKTETGLDRLIEIQITNYLRQGFHKHLGEKPRAFVERFSGLTQAVSGIEVPEADSPVLAVIPEAVISLEDQLILSGNRAFLRSADMRNHPREAADPTEPYAMLDISHGNDLAHLSANDAAEQIKTIGRTGLRLVELVSLGIHNREAWQSVRGLYAVGTEHELDGEATVVDFYRYGDDGGLKVKRDPGHINDGEWATPSAGSIVSAE